MQEASFEEMESCVLRRHNMDAHYITIRLVMGICKETVQIQGMWVVKR